MPSLTQFFACTVDLIPTLVKATQWRAPAAMLVTFLSTGSFCRAKKGQTDTIVSNAMRITLLSTGAVEEHTGGTNYLQHCA